MEPARTNSSEALEHAQPVVCGAYHVTAGECLSSIAAQTGHLWTTIWNHPDNAELKRVRDPHMLLPGDKLFIPPIDIRTEQAATNKRHKYVKEQTITVLRLLVMEMDEPLASQPYVLSVDGTTFRGTTDAEGKIEVRIPPKSGKGQLVVGEGDESLEYDFLLGTIDPINSITGIQARLTNLGYYPGRLDGVMGPKTRGAIEDFCGANHINPPPKEQISQELCDTLSRAHGF